jgi:hypothetical protein
MHVVQFEYVNLREHKVLEDAHALLLLLSYSDPTPLLSIMIATVYDPYLALSNLPHLRIVRLS